YSLNIGDYLSRGFELVGKQPGLFIGFTVVYFIILMVSQIFPLATAIVSPPLAVGFYLAAQKAEAGRYLEFGDFFKGFDFIGPLILITLIQTGLMILLMIPFGASLFFAIGFAGDTFDQGDVLLPVLIACLVVIPIMYLMISWCLAPFLVAFHKMDAWPAMEASRKIVSKNWFSFFLFYILVGIVMMAGALALGIGLIYTVPAGMCIFYAAFRDVVGLPEDNSDPTFLDHLVD
ncbi:MAG: BPSS1780 family membrane protein, partial [Bacteroidota bacterium]